MFTTLITTMMVIVVSLVLLIVFMKKKVTNLPPILVISNAINSSIFSRFHCSYTVKMLFRFANVLSLSLSHQAAGTYHVEQIHMDSIHWIPFNVRIYRVWKRLQFSLIDQFAEQFDFPFERLLNGDQLDELDSQHFNAPVADGTELGQELIEFAEFGTEAFILVLYSAIALNLNFEFFQVLGHLECGLTNVVLVC